MAEPVHQLPTVGTDGRNSDKVAEYVASKTALADVGQASLDYTGTTGGAPGFQLVVDVNGDGTDDGILVGEPKDYGQDWWLANPSKSVDFAGAPGAGHGYAHSGTLADWSSAYPDATVTAFGFSLGSGVKGDGVLNAIDFAGTRYTFARDVVLHGKDDCLKGGWATSTLPAYPNQGQCVSSFASKVKRSTMQ